MPLRDRSVKSVFAVRNDVYLCPKRIKSAKSQMILFFIFIFFFDRLEIRSDQDLKCGGSGELESILPINHQWHLAVPSGGASRTVPRSIE